MNPTKVKPTIEALLRRRRIGKRQLDRVLADSILRENEERYRTMADATPVMMWQSGPDKLCTYCNQAWLEFTGRTMERELGSGWLAGVHPDDIWHCLDTYLTSFEQRVPFVTEYRLRHHSGEYRWILDRGTPLYSSGGTFLGYVGGCIDIHDRKLAEQDLRHKQEQLHQTLEFTQAIIANMGEALYALDTSGRITYVNPAAERLFEQSSAELTGRKLHDTIHFKHADGSPFPPEECSALQALKTGAVLWNQEVMLIRKDGSCLNVSYNSSPLRSAGGNIVGRVVVLQDITAKKRAEELIRRGPEWFKSIIETAQDAVISVDISERKRIEHEVEIRGRQQAAVAELGRRALSLDWRALMSEACVLASRTLGTEFSEVLQFVPDDQAFHLIAGVGWREGLVGKARIPAGAGSQSGYTMLTHDPVVVEDLSRETRFSAPAHLHEHGIVSGLSIVIPGRDFPFGVMGAHTVTRRTFTNDDIHFLEDVANLLSATIERSRTEDDLKRSRWELRALAARLQAAREEERASLAREIHDELGGALTALRIDVSLLPARAAQDPNLLVEQLRSMTALIDRTLDRMRAIVTGLRPVVLDKFGLVAALEWQLSKFQRRSGITCEFDLPNRELLIDSERSTAIFRIVQEALTNVARHAEANKVNVVLRRQGEELILVVRDNGKGIDAKTIHASTSLGLVGMRERVLALGGSMEIRRLPQRGTQMTVMIPMG